MGLFDFLFGGKKRTNLEVVPDHIWMTTDAKFIVGGHLADKSRKALTELARSESLWKRRIPSTFVSQLGEVAIGKARRHPNVTVDQNAAVCEFDGLHWRLVLPLTIFMQFSETSSRYLTLTQSDNPLLARSK